MTVGELRRVLDQRYDYQDPLPIYVLFDNCLWAVTKLELSGDEFGKCITATVDYDHPR